MSVSMETIRVGILIGSPSDRPLADKIVEALTGLSIGCEVKVLSAHRTPDRVVTYVKAAEGRGIGVLIACAGLAAHLAGVVAAHTLLPVIGVPVAGGTLLGLDALLATVQMPPGIPVATVAIDGGRNAAILAARILALHDPDVRDALQAALDADRLRYDQV
jgi:5-(carboxyamino)imidazole ribonucleotide mutase